MELYDTAFLASSYLLGLFCLLICFFGVFLSVVFFCFVFFFGLFVIAGKKLCVKTKQNEEWKIDFD